MNLQPSGRSLGSSLAPGPSHTSVCRLVAVEPIPADMVVVDGLRTGLHTAGHIPGHEHIRFHDRRNALVVRSDVVG